jgi:hypothetical protein
MTGRRSVRVAAGSAAVLTALIAATAVGAAPAGAHNMGQAVVLVRQFTVQPAGSGWQAAVILSDFDSGAPIRDANVAVYDGSAPAAAAGSQLDPGSTPGTFAGPLSTVKAGANHLELKIKTKAGSSGVQPFDKAWDVTLEAGKPFSIVADSGGGGGSNVGLIAGVTGGVVGIALLYGLFVVRRRTAVPAAAKARQG